MWDFLSWPGQIVEGGRHSTTTTAAATFGEAAPLFKLA